MPAQDADTTPGVEQRRSARRHGRRRRRPRRARRVRSATAAFPAPRPRPVPRAPAVRRRRARAPSALDRSDAQDRARLATVSVDDRRLDADAARTAFEHEVDVVAEVGAHVRGGRRAHPPEPVGRRRRDRRRRTRRATRARPDGPARAGRPSGAHRSPRRRSRSDRLRSTSVSGPGQNVAPRACGRRRVRRAAYSSSAAPAAMCTITGWSAGRPFTRYSRRSASAFAGVGAQPVHGLGRERDQPAAPQHRAPRSSMFAAVVGRHQ